MRTLIRGTRQLLLWLALLMTVVISLQAWALRPMFGNKRQRRAVYMACARPVGGGATEEKVKVPNMGRIKNAWDGLWHGALGGLGQGLGMALLGAPIGSAAGGMLAASVLGGTDGHTIAVVSGMEAGKQLLFSPDKSE